MNEYVCNLEGMCLAHGMLRMDGSGTKGALDHYMHLLDSHLAPTEVHVVELLIPSIAELPIATYSAHVKICWRT